MTLFRNLSLQRKQMLIIMLTSMGSLLLACAAFVAYEISRFHSEMVASTSSLAAVIGKNLTTALQFDDAPSAAQTLASLRGEPSIVLAHVHTADGREFATYVRDGAPPPPDIPHSIEARHQFTATHLHLFHPITHDGGQIGTIELVASLNELRARLWRYAGIAGVVLAASLLAALGLSSRLQKLVSDPILHLAAVARAVALEKDYSKRADKRSNDELGQLVDGFNEMLDQIQERDGALQAARDNLEGRVNERTQDLAGSLSLLNATLEASVDAVAAIDLQGNFTCHNRKFVELWQFSEEVIRRHKVDEMVSLAATRVKDPEAFTTRIQEMLSTPEQPAFDVIEFNDGRIIERVMQPQFIGEQCVGGVFSFRDITDRKWVEEALRESQALYYSLVEQMPGGVFRKDAAGRFVFVNSWFCQLKGCTADDLLGRTPVEAAAIESRETGEPSSPAKARIAALAKRGTEHHERIMQTGQQIEVEEEYPGADGKPRYLHVVKSPTFGGDGQIAGSQGILLDITGRRRADDELRRTEELYRQAIAGADAVPYAYRFDTKSYAFMGAGIKQLIGYAPEEMNPGLWQTIIQKSVMRGETAGLEKAEAARRVARGELRHWRCDMLLTTRDGQSRWISDSSVQELDTDGKPVGSMGILQDITERKQAEIATAAFSTLGRRLSTAASREEAARIIGEVSDDLFGWDAFSIQAYSRRDDTVRVIYEMDTFEGQRIESSDHPPRKATALHHRVFESGAELVLRDPTALLPGAISFGNQSRPSASIMYVPIRSADDIVGIISVHSYSVNKYTERNLVTLQTLADHCGGALRRIEAGQALQESESQFRLVWDTSADGMRLANREGTVLLVNTAYCRLVEKTRMEVEGQSLAVVHRAENAEHVLRGHRERMDSGATQWHHEAEVTLWNGRKVWFDISNSILSLPGQPPVLLSIFRDISERKAAAATLETIHRQLLDVSRRSGMAEIATNVLHNVGNVLNSVNISTGLIVESVKQSRASGLARAVDLLREHPHDLGEFITHDARGKQLPVYLAQLSEHLLADQAAIVAELDSLRQNVEHIKEIVAIQQDYATVGGVKEVINVVNLVEDSLRMNAGALSRHRVEVIREFETVPPMNIEKHKILQILVNLVRNAKYACDESEREDKRLTLRVSNGAGRVRISVMDNGVGILPENLTRIFSHGFTTRKGGHGFGLHSGALAAREMGGALTVHSDGPGQGATFTLELPLSDKENADE